MTGGDDSLDASSRVHIVWGGDLPSTEIVNSPGVSLSAVKNTDNIRMTTVIFSISSCWTIVWIERCLDSACDSKTS